MLEFVLGLIVYFIVALAFFAVLKWYEMFEDDEGYFAFSLLWPLGIPFVLGIIAFAKVDKKIKKIKEERNNATTSK